MPLLGACWAGLSVTEAAYCLAFRATFAVSRDLAGETFFGGEAFFGGETFLAG